MPRTTFVNQPWAGKNTLKGLITVFKEDRDCDNNTVAQLLGVAVGTLQNRLRDPGGWRLSEIAVLSKLLKIPAGDIVVLLQSGELRIGQSVNSGLPRER